jgi:type VI secretion system Hcp family effector
MNRGRFWIAAATAALMVIIPATAFAAWYAKFDGVDGSSKAAGHDKWIELQSFSVGLTPQSLPRGAGRVTVTKRQDVATPKLMEAATKGKVFPSVRLDVSSTSGGRTTYIRYELKNVYITSYSIGGASSAAPTETMALNFERIVYLP